MPRSSSGAHDCTPMNGLLKLVVALGVEAALAAFVIVGIGLYKVIRSGNKQVDAGEERSTGSRAK